MRIITTRLMRPRWALSFLGVIWCRDRCWLNPYVINHETIHLRQQQEMLFLPFYVAYVSEFLWRAVQYRSFYRGYLHISHEREAYEHDHDLTYLSRRRHFAQFRG